ncbi:hypothetical protein [Persicobacter sp. CCB-QB2]|nr:hypothetical protein [Persicobacter sp. CCB-QB2]
MVLFSHQFLEATDFFLFQQIGDFFFILSYLLAFLVTAQSRAKVYLSIQFGATLLYLALVAFFSSRDGIVGIVEAHALRSIIYFGVLLLLNRRILL